jgi:hypothetical protein
MKNTLKNVNDCINYAKKLNPKKEGLTIEKLRSFPGCEHYSDKEATEIIDSVNTLALIVCEGMEKDICIDNQQVVNSNRENQGKIISLNSEQTKSNAA